jgi:hypothetical protein
VNESRQTMIRDERARREMSISGFSRKFGSQP